MPLPLLLAALSIAGAGNLYTGGPDANEPALVEIVGFEAKNDGVKAATLKVTGGKVLGCEDLPDLPRAPKIREVAVDPQAHGSPDASILVPAGATKHVDLTIEPFSAPRSCTIRYRVSLLVDGKPRTADLALEVRFRLPLPDPILSSP